MSKKLTAPVQIVLAGVIATGTSLLTISPQSLAAPSHAEFMTQMQDHRNLVQVVGLFIFSLRPELFPNLSERLVAKFLELHDLPKVMPLPQLNKFLAGQDQTIAERLVPFYGKRREDMNKEEFETLMLVTGDLNNVEDHIKNKFYEHHGVRSLQKGELLFLEHLADFAVTELTRQDELPGFNAVMILEQKGDEEEADVLEEMLPQIRAYLESRKDCQHLLAGN